MPEWTPETLPELLGRRFRAEAYGRTLLYCHHSQLYDDWGLYIAADRSGYPLHSTLEHRTAQAICDWLNMNTVQVLPGWFDGRSR